MKQQADELLFKKEQRIYTAGSTPLGAYFVLDGLAKVSTTGTEGKEQIVRVVGKNELLCCADLVERSHYSSTATALSASKMWFVPRKVFMNILVEQPKLMSRLMRLMAGELKRSEKRIADLAYKPVRGRLADTLLLLTQPGQNLQELESGSITISRADLASYVGTAKETVNRILCDFRREELIEADRVSITVINPTGLSTVSEMYN